MLPFASKLLNIKRLQQTDLSPLFYYFYYYNYNIYNI